jgi:malate dehydrogenase
VAGQHFIPTVAKRGAAIIEARGASSAASAASATVDHARTWAQGTPEGDWVSMAVRSDGSYGVQEGIISSFPVTVTDGQWSIVQGLEIDEFSRTRIDATVAELVEERDAVKALGLISRRPRRSRAPRPRRPCRRRGRPRRRGGRRRA